MPQQGTLGHAYAYTRMCMHVLNLRAYARVPENMKGKFFCIKAEV